MPNLLSRYITQMCFIPRACARMKCSQHRAHHDRSNKARVPGSAVTQPVWRDSNNLCYISGLSFRYITLCGWLESFIICLT